jgi:hypothetical protein
MRKPVVGVSPDVPPVAEKTRLTGYESDAKRQTEAVHQHNRAGQIDEPLFQE